MSESKNEKQMIKSQIELLKQKYLKKSVAVQPNQSEKQAIVDIEIPKAKPGIEKKQSLGENVNNKKQVQNSKTEQKVKHDLVSNSKKQESSTQIRDNNKWSLKEFIEEKANVFKAHQPIKKQQELPQLQSTKFDERDPFSLKVPFHYSLNLNTQTHHKNPEFQQQSHMQSLEQPLQKRKVKPMVPQKDLNQTCKIWVQSPHKALCYLYYNNQNIETQNCTLQLTSKNPHFPGIVKQLAEQFIFNNSQQLKEGQKEVVYSMALQYFSPSPKYLSDVLLICLVKMSPTYASIYADQILRKMSYYMEKIIQLKKYILKQELNNFIKSLEERMQNLRLQGHKLSNQCFIWILILSPNSNYSNQILLTRNITDQKELMAIFCALYPEGKQNSLSILYLKCIDSLSSLFFSSGILQKVISHLNEIKVPEALYQPVKSLKLKLIKAADTKKQKRKGEEDRGFAVFLNQKIGKFKEVLQSKVNTKTKTEVYYDPVSAKYVPSVPPVVK